MKPDSYMKMYIGDWLKDTLHLDATSTGAYFLLVLAHWGKPGIPSNDHSLRTIARVSQQDWARVKAEISALFSESNGLWINKRSVIEYDNASVLYNERLSRMKAARAKNPNINPDISDQKPQISGQTSGQQSKSESDIPKGIGSTCASKRMKKPELDEIKEHFAKIGLPESEAERFFHYYESNGWRVGRNAMRSWKSASENWRRHVEESKTTTNGADKVVLGREYERILARMREIEGAYESHMGFSEWREHHRTEWKKLKERKHALKGILGITI